MNSLSILIYSAQLVENISVVLCVLLIIFGMLAAIWIIAYCASFSESEDFKEGVIKTRFIPITASILAFILVFLPSKQTIYLIAASEMGEQVVTNPRAIKVFDKLNVIINNELDNYINSKLNTKDQ